MLVAAPLAPIALGQDAQTDQAQALLKQGIKHFQAREYAQAQATLLKVNRDKLTDSDRKRLDAYLDKVNVAVKKQAADMEAYDAGVEALKANRLEEARRLFQRVAKSSYVAEQTRKDARAQAALVAAKIKAARALAQAVPTAPSRTQPGARPSTAPTKTVAPVATTQPALERVRAQEMQARIDAAKALILQGNEALDADRVSEAIKYFEQAVQVAPEYYPARERLEFARSFVGKTGKPSAVGRLQRMLQIRRQETETRYAQALRRAREAIQEPRSAADFDRAAEEVNFARTLLSINKSLFPEADYRAKKIETDELMRFIQIEKDKWQRQKVREQVREIELAKKRREEEIARRKAEKIATLKARVRSLRSERKYAQAVEVLETIRKLDPNDAWATEWYEQLRQFVLLQNDREAQRTHMIEEAKNLVDIRWSGVPWYELLRYPRDWPDITRRRQPFGAGEVAESEEDRAVRRRLRQTLPKLEFSGIELGDVIQFLRDVSNLNIHVKWAALQAAGLDKTTPVNVKLTNVTFEKALRTVLEDVSGTVPLNYIIDEGVITISTRDDLAQQTKTRVYDIRDLIVRVPNFEGPEISLGNFGGNNTSGNQGTSGTSGGLFGDVGGTNGYSGNDSGDEDDENEISRAELIQQILDLIRSTIDPDSWRANSGTIGSIAELGGQLVVTQTAENHRSLLDLLAQLREARALQINVEARFITVNSSFLNHIGIDLDFYFNIGSSTARQPDAAGTGWDVDPLTGARLVQAGPRVGQWQGGSTLNSRTTPIPLQLGSFDFAQPAQTGVGSNIASIAGTAASLAGTFLDDIQVDFLIAATQAHSGTRTLTAPRLTIYNGQRAYVIIGTEQAYVASLDPTVSENVAAFRPVVNTVVTGSVLDIEGTVSADRRYVNLTIRPQISSVVEFAQYQGALDENGNPVRGSGTIELPILNRQALAVTVSVPDGGTLLLGGQKEAGEQEREMGVPIVSKIPILNRLVTNRSKVRDERTLLILVKPKIIIQREYEEAAFPP